MRSGGSVLEAPPGAEEGALPPRAAVRYALSPNNYPHGTQTPRAASGMPLSRKRIQKRNAPPATHGS